MVKKALHFFALILFLLFVPQINVWNQENIYEKTLSSIVRVQYIFDYQTIFGEKQFSHIWASGILIEKDKVLTCYHVFSGEPKGQIKIFWTSGDKTRVLSNVEIIKYSKQNDLVLLKLSESLPYSRIVLAKKDPELGSDFFFIGHTRLPCSRIRFGKFMKSAQGVMLFPVYLGDSGGGVFNMTGELIGVIEKVYDLTESNVKHNTLIGYAIFLFKINEFLNE